MPVIAWPAHNYGLVGKALVVAKAMMVRFPWAVITDGRRTREDQAARMAANESVNSGWLERTYVDSKPKRALVGWLAAHPQAIRAATQTAFLNILYSFSDYDLRHLTRHLSGEAFDVKPRLDKPELSAWLAEQAAVHGGRFLDHEADLPRFHWQAP